MDNTYYTPPKLSISQSQSHSFIIFFLFWCSNGLFKFTGLNSLCLFLLLTANVPKLSLSKFINLFLHPSLSLSLSFCILHVLSLSIEPSIHQSKITIPSCTIPTECNKKKYPTFNFFTFCDCLSSPQGTKFLFLYLGWPNSQAVICTTASLQLTLVRSPSDWSFLPKNRIKQCKQIFVWICFYKMDHPWPLFH